MEIYSGIIKNWQIHNLSNGGKILTGTVVEDFKGRWDPGMHMRSSGIDRIVEDLVYTRNSIYLLKGEAGDPVTGGDWGDKVASIFY